MTELSWISSDETGGLNGAPSNEKRCRACEARDRAIDHEQSRRNRIRRFVERQLIARRWIAVVDLTDWCAQLTTAAGVDEEKKAKDLAYRRLADSILNGEFEKKGRPKILYLDPSVTDDGASPRSRLTREQFKIAFEATAMPPAPSLPFAVLNCCWLPRERARDWLESHGYRWARHFEPVAAAAAELTGDAGRIARGSDADQRQPRAQGGGGQDHLAYSVRRPNDQVVTEGLQPLLGKALQYRLEDWVRVTWGNDFSKLPGREELLRFAHAKPEFIKATDRHMRKLRSNFATDASKRGGAGLHRPR
jgi:hypothetical protein